MKNLQEITLLTAAAALNAAGTFDLQREEDHFVLLPVTAGTVSLTIVVEALNPDGVSWHNLATAAYTTVGAQPAILLSNVFGRSIRARVSVWTSGSVTVRGYAGKRG